MADGCATVLCGATPLATQASRLTFVKSCHGRRLHHPDQPKTPIAGDRLYTVLRPSVSHFSGGTSAADDAIAAALLS